MSRTVGNLKELGINLQAMFKALFNNQDLCKLLYYTTPDPLSEADIVDPLNTLKDLIKVVPRLGVNDTAQTKIAVVTNGGKVTNTNDQYQYITMLIGVYTPLDSWIIKGSNLRPIRILSEIIGTLDGKAIQGLGTIECRDFELSLLTDEVSCYNLSVKVLLNA